MGSDCLTKRDSARSSKQRPISSSSESDSENSDQMKLRRRKEKKHRSHKSRSEKDKEKSRSKKRSSLKKRNSSRRDDEDEKKRRRSKHKRRARREESSSSDSECSYSGSDSDGLEKPVSLVRGILKQFPKVAGDLKQLLELVDNGQAVDIRGIPDKSLRSFLKELFCSLELRRSDGLFFLPPKRPPTLEAIGPLLCSSVRQMEKDEGEPEAQQEHENDKEDNLIERPEKLQENLEASVPQRKRLIGPAMPSAELLAAAAELTEADALLRDADLEDTDDLFIGPPPPAVAAEAESANEAERFEEVARIISADVGKPYDVLGVNHRMPFDNMKKKYWKLSLMVHPDKCSHPEAHQAFVKLNQSFKELQDPDKRKEIDEKIKLKEEEEAHEIVLKSLREAAEWRRVQGVSLEGDDELLAKPQQPQARDEWMTKLPPERKPGIPTQSTAFSRTGKEGRGDTSMWTDNPVEKTLKAKQNYLEAYSKATALAAADDEKKRMGSDAELVDKYNSSRRSKSLVEKHQEESSRPKKKTKKPEKEEWVGQHPWKPWDREKDLTSGRQKVKLDSEDMAQGLSSRFSSGAIQRNFL